MFGDNIIYDAQRQVTLNLKQSSGINSNIQDIMFRLTAIIQRICLKIAQETW